MYEHPSDLWVVEWYGYLKDNPLSVEQTNFEWNDILITDLQKVPGNSGI